MHSLLIFAVALTALQSEAEPPVRFPAVQAKNLEGKELDFPEAFAARTPVETASIAILAFSKDQHPDAASWQRAVIVDPTTTGRKEGKGLAIWEFPVMGDLNGLLASMIIGLMSISDDATLRKARTVPLVLKKAPIIRALHLGDEKKIAVLVVDGKGRVLARTRGAYTKRKAAKLVDDWRARAK